MKVVQVDLRGGLELVEEVEEAESKHRPWTVPSGGEPPVSKELNAWWDLRASCAAFAVRYVDYVNARYVEHGQGNWGGWNNAGATVNVAKVEDGAKLR